MQLSQEASQSSRGEILPQLNFGTGLSCKGSGDLINSVLLAETSMSILRITSPTTVPDVDSLLYKAGARL